MPSKQLADEISLTRSLQGLIATYEELSVMRMQRIRESVLKTRVFIDALTDVFADVQQERWLHRARKKKKKEPNKPLLMLLTTNSPLAGPLVRAVFDRFVAVADDMLEADVVIAGKVGRELFKQVRPDRQFKAVPIADGELPDEDVNRLVKMAVEHQGVQIFYGRFNSLIEQRPVRADLSDAAHLVLAATQGDKRRRDVKFLFEPSIEEVVSFFDTQILGALVAQIAHESQLAVLGSRITAMEEASGRVLGRLQLLQKRETAEKKARANRKQRELMAGISLWAG